MPRVVLLRLLLAAVPFGIWFVWAWWARRSGRPMGSTPWPWLVAAGGLLVALSLLGTVVFHADNRTAHYVPGEPQPDGSVSKGHFEKTQP